MEGSLEVPGYTVGRRLGSTDSSMWLAVEDATGEPVTLRLVRGDARIVSEGLSSAVMVMRALDHPHIVPFYDVVDTPSGPVLVLGPAEGGSLSDVFVARHHLSSGEMVTACAPVAEALAEIHQHGIVHGTITPDDILFARDGRPMLAGVGLASIGARSYLRGATIAPEVSAGGGPEPAADVYSIAAMGIVALTGPVSADQLFAASAERLLATGVAPAAQAVVIRAIGRNASRRPDASTLVNALYAIADPEPVELVVPEPPPAVPPPMTFTDPGPGSAGGQSAGPRAAADPSGSRSSGDQRSGSGPSTVAGGASVAGGAGAAAAAAAGASGSAFGSDAEDAGELDQVTAYMRQVTDATPGRRARRRSAEGAQSPAAARSDESAAEASAGGRRGRERRQPTDPASGSGRRGRSAARAADEAVARDSDAAGDAEQAPARVQKHNHGGQPRDETGVGRRSAQSAAGDGSGRTRGSSRSARRSTAAAAEPSGPDSVDDEDTRGRRPSKGDLTRVASVLVVVLLVAGAVIIGTQVWGGDDELPEAGLGTPEASASSPTDFCGGPRPAPEEEPPEVSDWTQEIQRLHALRTRAFEEVDAELLCEVYAPTSDGLIADVQALRDYVDRGVRTQNLALDVIDAELLEQNGGTVILEISERRPAYELVDADGELVQAFDAEDETWTAELVPIADEGSQSPTWRFS